MPRKSKSAYVPVKTIVINPPELDGPDADQYKIIDTKITHRLAQRPASYVVLRYEVPALKRKDSHKFVATHTPFNVLDSSLADVSLLVGLLSISPATIFLIFCRSTPLSFYGYSGIHFSGFLAIDRNFFNI